MRRIEILQRLSPATRDELVQFVEDVTAGIGRRPLSDHLWLELRSGGNDGLLVVTVAEPRDAEATVIGLALVSPAHDGQLLEVVIDPAADDGDAIALDLADTALDAVSRVGGGRLTWWVDDATTSVEALAAEHGLAMHRRLHELRRPLPHPDRSPVATRAFVPGVDDDAWLGVNNRAFADHGEQGGWTRETLALRLAEPWFDADGFRVLDDDHGAMTAFCWTKVHHDQRPPVGEIYVIAVDPRAHGRGLGTAMTLAGLDWMSDHGITAASLWVDAGNTAAMTMYRRLGFEVHRTRTAFAGTLEIP
jgi:mycothiol synthase